jgi:hypothetical protein
MSYSDRPRNEDEGAEEAIQPGVEPQTQSTDSTSRDKTVIGACRSRRGAAIINQSKDD